MLEGAVFTAPQTRRVDVAAAVNQAVAAAGGNPFLYQAIGQQTKQRRLSEYEKYAPRERLMDSFAEHLSILEAIEGGDRRAAAASMRAHIRKSHENRPDFRKVRVLAHRRLTRR
jgi:DNA-binding GntR family transcriptional regulator